MRVPYSPLRYPGGKARLAEVFVKILERNELNCATYVEPYAGGGGAALALLFEEYVDAIVVNDADPRIWAFWKAVTEHNDSFVEKLWKIEVSVREWHRQRELYARGEVKNILELGFATFYLNRTTRSGIIHNGGPIGGYDQSGAYKIDCRFNRKDLAQRIYRIDAYSDRILVENEDGLGLLKRLSRKLRNRDQYLIYLDPPYYAKGAELYMNRFGHKDHALLAEYLRRQINLPWVLTYDNVKEVRDLYKGHEQIEFSLNYSAYTFRKGKEVLIFPNWLAVGEDTFEYLPGAA